MYEVPSYLLVPDYLLAPNYLLAPSYFPVLHDERKTHPR